jgi:hypothetical protein
MPKSPLDHPLNRRRFLQRVGLGAAALGLPVFDPLRPRGARADGQPPLRIVFFYDTNGLLNGHWEPSGIGGNPPAETAWELGPLHRPLAPWKDRIIAFRGLDMVTDKRDPQSGANAHISGKTHALTAAFRRDDRTSSGESINHFIARELNSPMPVTRLPSLEVAVRQWGSANDAGTYGPGGDPIPFLVKPPEVFDRAFPPELRATDGGRAAARRSAIFDLIRSEGDRLAASLPGAAREKVEQHLDTRADLERRLGLGAGRAAAIPGPEILAPWDDVDWSYQPGREMQGEIWDTMADLNTEMVAAALHADVTRVATIHVSHAADELWGYRKGDYGSDNWHDFVHKVSGDRPEVTARTAVEMLNGMHLRTMEKLAAFLDSLAARTEPDGSSLLDHTLVVFCSELANGSHDLSRLPWLTIGDAHGYFRTGRLLTFERRNTRTGEVVAMEDWSRWQQEGRPHNDFFASLANAMGIEVERFGEESVATGPIAEMR